PDENGQSVNLADLKGKPFVLFFYPKDNTPGCTKEACGFRDAMPDFSSLDCAVYGVSKDSEKSHVKFIEKHELNFSLLVDADVELAEALGVWKEKSMYGKKYMGIERSTFLVGADGVVKNVWRKVKVAGHVEEVLKALKEI
ncbi:MAG: thioredoxin-dependent thiol peroxidase, partial [Cohaesibacter sp.]|nr:thioredoxin-dependent thiol peroxidase [Cohaesibacter sp.]